MIDVDVAFFEQASDHVSMPMLRRQEQWYPSSALLDELGFERVRLGFMTLAQGGVLSLTQGLSHAVSIDGLSLPSAA